MTYVGCSPYAPPRLLNYVSRIGYQINPNTTPDLWVGLRITTVHLFGIEESFLILIKVKARIIIFTCIVKGSIRKSSRN